MSNILFTGDKFKNQYISLNLPTNKSVSFPDIIHAALTYSSPSVGIHGFFERHRRIFTIYAAIKSHKNEYIKTYTYTSSDQSEKMVYSYILGMTFCNMVALKELDFDYLLHFDLAKKIPSFNIFPQTRSKPDFIGCKFSDPNDYLVIEAKGQSGKFRDKPMNDGKKQVKRIATINGKNPLRVVVQTYFDKNLKVNYQDPDNSGDVSISFDINEARSIYFDFIKSFFRKAPELTERKIAGLDFSGFTICRTNLYVGILNAVYYSTQIDFEELKETVLMFRNEMKNKQMYLGKDGVIVIDES